MTLLKSQIIKLKIKKINAQFVSQLNDGIIWRYIEELIKKFSSLLLIEKNFDNFFNKLEYSSTKRNHNYVISGYKKIHSNEKESVKRNLKFFKNDLKTLSVDLVLDFIYLFSNKEIDFNEMKKIAKEIFKNRNQLSHTNDLTNKYVLKYKIIVEIIENIIWDFIYL